MRRFVSFIIVLLSLLLTASCGHRSSDKSSDDNGNGNEVFLDYSAETQMSSEGSSTSDDDDNEIGSDSDIDDGCSLDFDNLDDGSYSATVSYYNPGTGFSNSYDLDVEVENNEVIQIEFSNEGYLTASETVYSDGTCTVTDDRGCSNDVQIEE